MSRDAYIPVADLSGEVSERITWYLDLEPYIAGEVGVNIGRLDKIAKHAGFGNIAIGGYAGERSYFTPEAVAVDERGQATAGMKGSVVKADAQRSVTHAPRITPTVSYGEYLESDGTIRINMTELDRKVGDAGSVRDGKLWAKYLSKSLKSGVSDLLLENILLRGGAIDYGTFLMSSVYLTTSIDNYFNPIGLGSWVAFNQLLNYFHHKTGVIGGAINPSEHKRRHSLLAGVQFDRWAMVSGITAALPLVKAIRAKET